MGSMIPLRYACPLAALLAICFLLGRIAAAPFRMKQLSLPQDPKADGSYSRSDSALAECNYPESKSDTVHSVYSVAR